MKKLPLIVFTLLFLPGTSCVDFWANDYDFTTTAIYVAPKSGIKAFVESRGYVPKDADLSDDFEYIKAKLQFQDGISDSIVVVQSNSGEYKLKISSHESMQDYFQTVALCYEYLSFKTDSTEAIELSHAIFSTGSGPKGTYMKGQAGSIVVDTVVFSTKDR
jgi:hypothetical protein